MMESWPGPQTMTPPCFTTVMRFFSWNTDFDLFQTCPLFWCPHHSTSIQSTYSNSSRETKGFFLVHINKKFKHAPSLSDCRGMNFHRSTAARACFRSWKNILGVLKTPLASCSLLLLGQIDLGMLAVISNVLHLYTIYQAVEVPADF